MLKINNKIKEVKEIYEKAGQSSESVDIYMRSRVKVFLNSTGYTLLLVLSFAAVGFTLDRLSDGGGHKFLIISLMLGYPITQISVFLRFRKFAQNQINKTDQNG